jgi:hypothetical protein
MRVRRITSRDIRIQSRHESTGIRRILQVKRAHAWTQFSLPGRGFCSGYPSHPTTEQKWYLKWNSKVWLRLSALTVLRAEECSFFPSRHNCFCVRTMWYCSCCQQKPVVSISQPPLPPSPLISCIYGWCLFCKVEKLVITSICGIGSVFTWYLNHTKQNLRHWFCLLQKILFPESVLFVNVVNLSNLI